MTPRIKICGITRPEDAVTAANLGVDAIGLVFYAKSPRKVEIEQANRILSVVPPFMTVVGLFVDPSPYFVQTVLDEVSLDILQFHGNEPSELCEDLGHRYIKALRVGENTDIETQMANFPGASGFLLDTLSDKAPGGTGETFDWEKVPAGVKKPIILAGGLDPDNVVQAIKAVNPYAVDVSSGVEASKGIKDARKMAAFVQAVRA